MKKMLVLTLSLVLPLTSVAIETSVVNEKMQSASLREQVCEEVYFDFFDYGELFDGDLDGSEFSAYCAAQSIFITTKVQDSFPEGQTPKGFKSKLTTKFNFEFEGENEACKGYAVRTLPTSGFRITKNGEILPVKVKGNSWEIQITDCNEI